MELPLIKASFLLYCAAAACAFLYLSVRDERWSLRMLRLLGAGLVLHLSGFAFGLAGFWAAPEHRFFLPVNTFFGAFSYLAMAVAGVFFLVERQHRLGILGAFVLPWTVVGAGAALFIADPAAPALEPALRSYWLNIHPVVIMTAYAVFANAFGVGVALLIQENQIKSRKPSELCYRLPALSELDDLNARLIAAAAPILAAGILMGAVWAHQAWGRFWGWDAKETWALIVFVIYDVFLYLRLARGVRGRKAVYVSMAGFAAIVFTFLGVNFLSGLHGWLG